MTRGTRKLLICNCEGTMPLDGARLAKACGASGDIAVRHHLCRGDLAHFRNALAGGGPLLVACTQEVPLFEEIRAGQEGETDVRYVNIRERAGWSEQAAAATPKIAALLAEAEVEVPGAPPVSMRSGGTALIYGCDETALEAARQLRGRLDVTVLLSGRGKVSPPAVDDVPLYKGTVVAARGHLGAFEIVVDGHAAALPSSRATLAFEAARDGVSSRCDLILDLRGAEPLFPAHRKRDGYLRPDPGNPAAVQKAVFDLTDMVGEFEKPRYVNFEPRLCAHSRSNKTGCTRCLDACPASAIQPAGDGVAIDPYLCGGCGSCGSVCPTGAAGYALPPREALHERLRVLLSTFAAAGGSAPVVLLHDRHRGDEMIAATARHGGGLPARVLPFALNETSQAGFELLALAFAYGASRVLLLVDATRPDDRTALPGQVELADTLLRGLGYGAGRVQIVDTGDPEELEATLRELDATPGPAAGSFLAHGERREVTRLALHHLHDVAPAPVDMLALPAGAPFGRIVIDQGSCTLCLACVSACPAGALRDDPERPRVAFHEDACIQCGVCRNTCPEKAVTLEPRLNFSDAARGAVVLNEEEPFLCVRCGKPFASRSSVEKIAAKLAGVHSMYLEEAQMTRIRMCADCRVIDAFERDKHPMAGVPRPRTRTTEDYLRERAIKGSGLASCAKDKT